MYVRRARPYSEDFLRHNNCLIRILHTQYPEVREPGKFPPLIIIRGERYNIATTALMFRSKGKEDRITAWLGIILQAS
jgi:hypothetical protein